MVPKGFMGFRPRYWFIFNHQIGTLAYEPALLLLSHAPDISGEPAWIFNKLVVYPLDAVFAR